MKEKKMNILVCGLWWSGSGAVVDLLREYKKIGYVSIYPEFNDFRRGGMLADLILNQSEEFNTHILNKYINKIKLSFQLKKYSKYLFKKLFNRKYKMNYIFIRLKNIIPNNKHAYLLQNLVQNININLPKQRKIELINNYINELGSIYAKKNEYVLFDQPIYISKHSDLWPQIFAPFKLIIVFRDPRDQFADIIRNNHLFYYNFEQPSLKISHEKKRADGIQFHINTLMENYKSINYLIEKLGRNKILLINFEKLITDYELTIKDIENFIGIDSTFHVNKLGHFKPEVSKKNIKIYPKYLDENELQMLDSLMEVYNKLKTTNSYNEQEVIF